MRTVVITTIRLLQFFALGLLVPILSMLFLARGLTLSQLAFTFGLYSVTTILCEVPTGVIADLIGRKKTYMISIFFYIAAFSVILVGRSFFVLSVGNVLYGVSRALASGSVEALFIDDYTARNGQESLPRIMTIFSITEAVGLALGSLCGGLLPVLAAAHFPQIGKYDLNIIVKLVLLVVLLVLVATLVRERKAVSHERPRLDTHLRDSFEVVKNSRNLKLIFLVLLATGVFLSVLELYWQPRFLSLVKGGSGDMLLGVLATLYFGAVILGSLVVEKAAKKFSLSYKWIYFGSKMLTGCAVVFLAMQQGFWGFSAFYVLTYLFFGASNIPEGYFVNIEIPSERRASLLSFNSLVFQIGGLIGSGASGALIHFTTIPVLWIVLGGVVMVSAVAVALLRTPREQTAEPS